MHSKLLHTRHPSRALIFALLILWAGAAAISAQAGALVRVWQSQDGLPGNVVRSVVQASDGYLWVATAEGIARFNGFEFESVEAGSESSRHRLAFSRLFACSGGRVFAATYQGGLFAAGGGKLSRILANMRDPQPRQVTQLVEEAGGAVLIKRGEEVSRIDAKGGIARLPASEELEAAFAADLKQRVAGGRSVDANSGLVLSDRMGRVWRAGAGGGLTVALGGEAEVHVELPQCGRAFAVNELLEDSEGNLWAATHVNGLVRVRLARVEVVDSNAGQGEPAVSALLEDRAGTWWLAKRRGGLDQRRAGVTRHIGLSSARNPRPAAALFEDQRERLWVATQDGSVFRYDAGVFQPQFGKSQIPSKVRSITQDASGVLWFGGSQGLASLTGDTVHQLGREDGVEDLDLTVIQAFPGGKIIAGSSTGTVLLGNAGGFRSIAAPEVLKHSWISGILPLTASQTWVSTLGGGLFLWDGARWTGFDANDGLPDARLTCVLDDPAGFLWLGSLGGIIRVERRELLAHSQHPESAVRWLRLDHSDGLLSRECIGGFQPAGWRGRDGLLWFATGSGIARVRPEVVEANPVAPPVYLQNVSANGMIKVGAGGPVTTAPGRARLEFHFVGISLSAPEKITYRARLAGLDDAWRELGSQRVAAFEAVPPGRYTFEVMAINGDGLRSEAAARMAVVIPPQLWQTAWFYMAAGGCVVLLATGSGWLAARMRLKGRIQALKVRQAAAGERTRIARDLHDELGASLTEISMLAALAAEDAAQSELRPQLDQLSVKAKHVVGNLDEIVWAVNPREDTLRSLVDYLAAFAREFLDIARIPLRLDVAREIPAYPLATAQRHGLYLVTREALNNIVKHAAATQVMLGIAVTDQRLEISIADDGRGFEPDEVVGGDGLGNLKQRMHQAGGECRIESSRGHGTRVFLSFPLPGSTKPVS